MATYAIYKYSFLPSQEKNFLAQDDERKAIDKAQDILGEILKDKLPIVQLKKDSTFVPLDNYVTASREGVTVLVVCNDKNHKYKEKMEERELEYHPGNYVIIDNRPGVAQLAIEQSSSFGKPDKVALLLCEAFNKQLDAYGLKVEIRSKWRTGKFWDAVQEQCEKYQDKITRVTYSFPNDENEGPIDASRQLRNEMRLMRSIAKAMNATKGQMIMESDKGGTLRLDRTQEDIARMVALCANNGYDISVHFKYYGLYRFGADIRALAQLKEELLKDFTTSQTVMGKAYAGSLIGWLDKVRNTTEGYRDEDPTEKKRKRRHQD